MGRVVMLGSAATLLYLTSAAAPPKVDATGLAGQTCAMRDRALSSLIEENAETGATKAENLADALADLLNARRACEERRVGDAFSIYDRVDLELSGRVYSSTLYQPATND